MNLSSFSVYRNYSYWLTLSNVFEPFWIWIPRDHIQVQKAEIKFRRTCCLFTFAIKHEYRHLHVVLVQKRQRNIRKSVMRVLLIKPIALFYTLSLPSRRWMLGPVNTYRYSFENATFFSLFSKNPRPLVAFSHRFRPSTRIRWIDLKTITYPTAHAWRPVRRLE